MGNDRLNGHKEALQLFRLSVLRVKGGEQKIVRMLSEQYKGFFVHHVKKRSEYCPGRNCDCQNGKFKRQWRGYVAAELYDQRSNLWLPSVLEITEYLELDFRNVYRRGQVWQLKRDKSEKLDNKPLMGKLLEERPPETFPPPHRIYDVLLNLYGVPVLEMVHDNPQNERTYVRPSVDAPPKIVSDQVAPSAEETRKAYEIFRKSLNDRGLFVPPKD